MSDLHATSQQGSNPARYQDARAQADAAAAQAGITTPRQIMAARNAREARKAQQQAQDTGPSRRRQQEGVVGVATDFRRPDAGNRIDYSAAAAAAEEAARLPAGQNVTIGSRAGNTVQNQGQLRPVAGQQSYQYQQPQIPTMQASQIPADASRIQRNRTEAYEKLEMPAVAGARQQVAAPQTSEATPAVRSAFPHAFERWETLSSHWEGLTSYWIRRLQENTNELDSKPIDKQMARQITDLSAAGANLFHAVVELQRLRASSERKFQRWFFENREEQERSREEIAELQRQLQAEKQNKPQQISNVASEALQAEKRKADELVREMRRELQISKEEARRAWEELGRREQEERERTIALRSGEATLIGGVQVLPMQGLSSRHNTSASQRPVTRDGPYSGGPTATMMGGQQAVSRSQTTLESPTQEHQQFSYQPDATSPTDTDPFTETAPCTNPPLRHEPDTQFLHTGSPLSRQPVTSAQAMAAARAAVASPASQRSMQNRSEGPSYIPSTQGGSIQSEEEYHIGPDGQYLRDSQGRPIPYRQPIGGYEEVDSDDEDHTADAERERMLAQQYAQRQQQSRLTPQLPSHTSSRSPQQFAPSAYAQATTIPQQYESPASQHTNSSTLSPPTPQQLSYVHAPTTSATTTSPAREDPADYEGAAYGSDPSSYPPPPPDPTSGQNTGARHHVPTRLSDIIEERTEPSRSSAISATPTTNSDTHPQGGILGTRR